MRKLVVVAVLIFIAVLAFAKDKRKQELTDFILNARTVIVVVDKDAGISITNPNENTKARTDVEDALRRWGRFEVRSYGSATDMPDLIISIRKGGARKTVITGVPDPRETGGISTAPNTTTIGTMGGPRVGERQTPTRPRTAAEFGPTEDTFEVFMSGMEVPMWKFSGRNALDAPANKAVEEFKAAFTRSEEVRKANAR